MIAYVEVPPVVDVLERELKELGEKITVLIPETEHAVKLDSGSDVFAIAADSIVSIMKGVFKYYHGNKLIRLYQKDDVLLIPRLPDNHGCRCISEFGAEIVILGFDDFDNSVLSDPQNKLLLFRYQSLQSIIMHILCAAYSPDDIRPDITIQKYENGDTIIAEGDPAVEIYQMMQGSASVTVKGTEVGVVQEGEVFGEISFFTENMRSATVTARSECLVQVMRKDTFIEMLKLKPSVNMAISKTLSQRLIETNRKISDPQ